MMNRCLVDMSTTFVVVCDVASRRKLLLTKIIVMFSDHTTGMEVAVSRRPKHSDAKAISGLYNLENVVAFILRRGQGAVAFQRVALQFPDELLPDTVLIVQKLRELLAEATPSTKLFVLADTTFASCCPDEITAEHYQADAIVHFGYACLSKTTRLPVHYVHQHRPLDVASVHDAVADMITHASQEAEGVSSGDASIDVQLILFFSASVSHRIEDVQSSLSQLLASRPRGVTVLIASPSILCCWNTDCPGWASLAPAGAPWCINGVTFPTVEKTSSTVQRILCLGPSDEPHVAQLCLWGQHQRTISRPDHVLEAMDNLDSNVPSCCTAPSPSLVILGQDGASHVLNRSIQQRLRQRMFNIEALKGANAIGILVASLAIEGFRETAEVLKRLVRASSTEARPRRAYILFVGHLNQYKVANFADCIDCFVAIACPNSKECHFPTKEDAYLKPVASPSELLIALGALPFDHPYAFTTNFRVLQRAATEYTAELIRTRDSEKKTEDDDGASSTVLVKPIGSGALTTTSASSSAIQRLYERSYVGLEPKVGETPVQQVIEDGRNGIARGYATERVSQQTAQ
jgi:diphthamide biosynthesis protein 2